MLIGKRMPACSRVAWAKQKTSLRQALQFDPRHAAARQALAALLVELRRLDRAEQVLQQGLELQPGNSGYAMTLARIQVERGDVATALCDFAAQSASWGKRGIPWFHGGTVAAQRASQGRHRALSCRATRQLLHLDHGCWGWAYRCKQTARPSRQPKSSAAPARATRCRRNCRRLQSRG